MTTLNQNMKEIIERVIKNKQLEEFLNNEKILSLKQEDLDQIYLMAIKLAGIKTVLSNIKLLTIEKI